MTDAAPDLTDLLKDAPTNWGKWGPEDEVGSLNYLGPEQAIAAAALVRSGKVFTLQRLIGDPKGDPVWPGRSPAVRTQIMDEASWDGAEAPQFPGGLHYADDKINAFLQGSTQYDALGHVWYGGKLWNGYDARTTVGGMDKASVQPIAERGVVGRAVLRAAKQHIAGPSALNPGKEASVQIQEGDGHTCLGAGGHQRRRRAGSPTSRPASMRTTRSMWPSSMPWPMSRKKPAVTSRPAATARPR